MKSVSERLAHGQSAGDQTTTNRGPPVDALLTATNFVILTLELMTPGEIFCDRLKLVFDRCRAE